MILGLEYVLSAYGIWLCTFFVYVLLTKQRTKFIDKSISALKQNKREHSTKSKTLGKNEK